MCHFFGHDVNFFWKDVKKQIFVFPKVCFRPKVFFLGQGKEKESGNRWIHSVRLQDPPAHRDPFGQTHLFPSPQFKSFVPPYTQQGEKCDSVKSVGSSCHQVICALKLFLIFQSTSRANAWLAPALTHASAGARFCQSCGAELDTCQSARPRKEEKTEIVEEEGGHRGIRPPPPPWDSSELADCAGFQRRR